VLENGIPVRQRTNNLEAYDYYLRGLEEQSIWTPDGFAGARNMFEKAITLDPAYSDAYASTSFLCLMAHNNQWDKDRNLLNRAYEFARKAVLLDRSSATAYSTLGWVAAFENHREEALADGERAISLDPNSAFAFDALAEISGAAGRFDSIITYAKKAMRLDPSHPEPYLFEMGWRYLSTGHYREAANALNASLPNSPFTHVGLAYVYVKLGREQDARAEAAQVFRLSPTFSVEVFRQTFPEDWESPKGRQFLADLRKAGFE
jgi:adenylate cyclase